METEEIITQLYALRAGLSLIAKQNDMYDAEIVAAEREKSRAIGAAEHRKMLATESARRKMNNALSNADTSRSRLESLERKVTTAKALLGQKKEMYERNEESLKKIKTAKKDLAKSKRAVWLQVVAVTVFILIHIAAAVMLWTFNSPLVFAAIGIAILCPNVIEIVIAIKNKDKLYRFMSGEYNGDTAKHPVWVYIVNIILYVAAIICFIFIGNKLNGAEKLQLLAVHGIAILFSLACIIVTGIFHNLYRLMGKDEVRNREYDVRSKNDAFERRDRLQQEHEDASRAYEEAQKEYVTNKDFLQSVQEKERNAIFKTEIEAANATKDATNEYNSECAKAESKYTAAVSASKNTHGRISVGIWETLITTYGKLLDARDWKILDIVIWQLETGRADTVKEALQLADREIQTERIVQTMLSASAAISQRIEDGFGNLQTQLNRSFYALATCFASVASSISNQISKSSDLIAGKIDENAQATATLYESQRDNMITTNRNFEQLFSQASLQTALLEKSNHSSKELIETVKKMRNVQNT